MAELKCEFPEGCMLDLFAQVVKSRYCEREVRVLDTIFCVPDEQVGGKIQSVEDIKVKVLQKYEDLGVFNKVKIFIEFEVILFVKVDSEYQIITVTERYDQVIALDEFDPPLTVDEFKNEVSDSVILLSNWTFDYEIRGDCESPHNPCCLTTPVNGTCIALRVFVDITDKLTKMHDVIVYGEIEPADFGCK